MSMYANNDFITSKPNPSSFICSRFASVVLNNNRSLISFGNNSDGYLGHEDISAIIYPPKQIPNVVNIKMIDCGENHIACVNYDGILFTFGGNKSGKLGIGKNKDELPFTHIPQQVIDIPPIDSISCGKDFTVCITYDRNLYSFGDSLYGKLGLGDKIVSSLSPQLIPGLNDVEIIQCGREHTICKTYSNEFYSWGSNSFGQMGLERKITFREPNKCSNWPENIIDIKCGEFHTILLTSTGYIYAFGSNYYGQLGLGNIFTKNIPTLIKDIPVIKRIECGIFNSMCIDINDRLWVFGNNEHGQLGLGDHLKRYKPILNESLHDIIDISSGGNQTFVKTINNEIYAFGNNEFSQLGIKTSEIHQLTPIQVFKDNEDIWASINTRCKQKSARK